MSNLHTFGIIGANGKAIEGVTIQTSFGHTDHETEAAFARAHPVEYEVTETKKTRQRIVADRTRKSWCADGATETKFFPIN